MADSKTSDDRSPAVGGNLILFTQYCDEGVPDGQCFEVASRPEPTADSLAEGEVLVKLHVVSVDPYMRGRMRKGAKGYIGPFVIGEPVSGFVAGRVLASRSPAWEVGAYIGTSAPYATVQRLSVEQLMNPFTVNLTGFVDDSTVHLGIGAYGMPGATAYYGLLHVATGAPLDVNANPRPPVLPLGQPLPPAPEGPSPAALEAGKTIFVNAARGAVGSLVVQIARQFGVRTVGCAGGPAKCGWLKEHGASATVDYRGPKDAQELRAAMVGATAEATGLSAEQLQGEGCFDYVFENVGGMQFTAYQPLLRNKARVAVCGAISGYNADPSEREKTFPGLDLGVVIGKSIGIQGFLVMPLFFNAALKRKWLEDMRVWIEAKVVVPTSTVVTGASKFAEAFSGMMTGKNDGKMVVDVTQL